MLPLQRLPWPSLYSIVLALAGIAFFGLGVRTFFFPEAAAAFFGAATTSPEALVFVKAYGARNIAISLTVLTLLVLGHRAALAAVLAYAAGVAALDALNMFAYGGPGLAAKHIAYVIFLGGLAAGARFLRRAPAAATATGVR